MIICSVLGCLVSCSAENVLYTDNSDNYNTDAYPIGKWIFISEIPDYAEVKNFVYYDYWHEVQDIYLELIFKSEEDMKQYVSLVIEHFTNCFNNNNHPKPIQGLYIEEQNPYDTSYTDIIFTVPNVAYSNGWYVGYKIDHFEDNVKVESCVSIISYSYDKLTVIQASMDGFYDLSHPDYTFKYYTKFNILSNEDHERIIDVEYEN